MDSEDRYAAYRAIKQRDQQDRATLRQQASADFDEARGLAGDYGLTLFRCSESHYQLMSGEWRINVYPSTHRIYSDPRIGKAPRLELPDQWGLLDVVRAAIERVCEHGQG